MSGRDMDELEVRLRVLGRSLGDAADAQLLARTKFAAGAALADSTNPEHRRFQRLAILRLVLVLIVTLPIPAAFLWADGAALFSLLRGYLPQQVSSSVVGAYLWIKVCALATVYGIGIPLLAWLTIHSSRPGISDEEGLVA